ncbi:unnamed protein product [Prorocentrum cordatum]|uniref:C2 domain-containing protein n=1 Tax=Prorocentrum cordatum TaxID=2364126 RepID=A0ABN9T5D0_9DINO|nr:unnamed protein product [Polarella glacialis]
MRPGGEAGLGGAVSAAAADAALAEHVRGIGRDALLSSIFAEIQRVAERALLSTGLVHGSDGTCALDNIFMGWCVPQIDTVDDFEHLEAHDRQGQTCWFRACVHSGFYLPPEARARTEPKGLRARAPGRAPALGGAAPEHGPKASYVRLQILGGSRSEVHRSRVVPACELHLWELCVEEEVIIAGHSNRLLLQVYGKRQCMGDRLLGCVEVPLPQAPTQRPRRQRLLLRDAPSAGCGPPLEPELLLAWEVCEERENRPSLVQLAEMGDAATVVRCFVLEVKLKLAGGSRSRIGVSLWRADSAREALKPVADADGEAKQDHQVHEWRWEMQDSRAALLAYDLQVDRFDKRKGKRSGTWRASLGSLMREVDRVRGPVPFTAEFPSAASSRSSKKSEPPVEFSLDLYCKRPWASPKEQLEGAGAETPSGVQACVLPSRALHPHGDRPRLVSYYCCIVAEGLPRQHSAYVRIIVGNGDAGPREGQGKQADADADPDKLCHYESDRILTDWTTQQLMWRDIQVILPLSDCRVRVQIWSEASQTLSGSVLGQQDDRLVCQAVISPVSSKADNWYHCYGGARDANRAEEARQMAFGIIHPASTYWCSVGMRLSFWPSNALSQDAQHWSYLSLDHPGWQLKEEKFIGGRRTLTVRLHRCLYLSSLAGSRVTVFVELAGNHFGGQAPQPLLAFPGSVSQEGVLLFHAPTDPSATGCSLWSPQPEPAAVERCTQELSVRPGVTHAYVYVVQAGYEARPPRIFGRMRLGQPGATPKWQRLRFDASVAELPSVRFDREFAGCFLGSAVLQPGAVDLDKGRWLPEVMSSGAFGFSQPGQTKLSWGARAVETSQGVGETLFYHMDVLAARALPPSNDAGLCSAGYRIHVEGKTLVHDQNIQESLNPTFWDRAVIPVEADGYGTPAPPLVITIFDDQASGVRELGSLFIKDLRRIDASSVEELNSHHSAFWYALDSTAVGAFDPGAATDALRCSPRLLVAIAYSSVDCRSSGVAREPAFSRIPVLHWTCYCKAEGVTLPVPRGQHRRNPNFESDRADAGSIGAHLQGHICHVPEASQAADLLPRVQGVLAARMPPGRTAPRELRTTVTEPTRMFETMRSLRRANLDDMAKIQSKDGPGTKLA